MLEEGNGKEKEKNGMSKKELCNRYKYHSRLSFPSKMSDHTRHMMCTMCGGLSGASAL